MSKGPIVGSITRGLAVGDSNQGPYALEYDDLATEPSNNTKAQIFGYYNNADTIQH